MRIKPALAALLVVLGLAPAAFGQQVVTAGPDIRNPALAVIGTGDFIAAWNDVDDGAASLALLRSWG